MLFLVRFSDKTWTEGPGVPVPRVGNPWLGVSILVHFRYLVVEEAHFPSVFPSSLCLCNRVSPFYIMWCNIFTRQIAETYKIKQLLAVKNRYFRKAGLRLWRHRPEIGAVKISKNQQEHGEISVWSSQQTKKMVILKFIKTQSGLTFTSHTLCYSV